VVRYTTINRDIVTRKVDVSVDAYSQYEEGDTVAVLSRENEPENFVIDDNSYKKATHEYVILGILILLISLFILLCKWDNLID